MPARACAITSALVPGDLHTEMVTCEDNDCLLSLQAIIRFQTSTQMIKSHIVELRGIMIVPVQSGEALKIRRMQRALGDSSRVNAIAASVYVWRYPSVALICQPGTLFSGPTLS
jgi:hypothetical protein